MRNRLLDLAVRAGIGVGCCALAGLPACSPSAGAESEGSSTSAISGGFPVGTPLATTAAVNQRQSPSPSAAILQVIPSSTVVASAAALPVAGWYGVTWNGKTGWVDGQYLERASDDAPGRFTREQVYALVAERERGGGDPRDLLDPALTTQRLVDAVGWLATHAPPDWGFSVINSGHHWDPAAHSGGFAIDMFANAPADDARFVDLVNQDPYFVEIGVSGDYVAHEGGITSAGKCVFVENAPTHVHAAVQRAFC